MTGSTVISLLFTQTKHKIAKTVFKGLLLCLYMSTYCKPPKLVFEDPRNSFSHVGTGMFSSISYSPTDYKFLEAVPPWRKRKCAFIFSWVTRMFSQVMGNVELVERSDLRSLFCMSTFSYRNKCPTGGKWNTSNKLHWPYSFAEHVFFMTFSFILPQYSKIPWPAEFWSTEMIPAI